MENFDFNIDENEFDNFNNFIYRRRRPRRKQRDMRTPNEEKEVSLSISNNMETERKKKRNKHKAVLNKLKEQGFFHNRYNHKGIYNQVKKMAIEIDDLSKKLIKEKAKSNCKCGGRKVKMKYKNFDGGQVVTAWNRYKTPLLIGGAIYFFFFSEMGKKMIKK